MKSFIRSALLRCPPPGEVRHNERGASLVEYALLVSLIAMVCFAAVMFFGRETSTSFSSIATSVQAT